MTDLAICYDRILNAGAMDLHCMEATSVRKDHQLIKQILILCHTPFHVVGGIDGNT